MPPDDNEEKLLRSVALQNAQAILLARERAERELIAAKEALERKSAELAAQREFFRVTLASIGDAVITTDTSAKVTFLNPVAESHDWMEGERSYRSTARESIQHHQRTDPEASAKSSQQSLE